MHQALFLTFPEEMFSGSMSRIFLEGFLPHCSWHSPRDTFSIRCVQICVKLVLSDRLTSSVSFCCFSALLRLCHQNSLQKCTSDAVHKGISRWRTSARKFGGGYKVALGLRAEETFTFFWGLCFRSKGPGS